METCILIPREFSIVLKAFASPPSPEHTPRKKVSAGTPASAAIEELRSRHWDFSRHRPKLNTLPKKAKKNEAEKDSDTTATTIPSPTSSPELMEDDMGDQPPKPKHQVLRPIPIYSPLEMGATVWANVPLYPGQVFYPDQGEIRLDHLEIYNILPRYDVSTCFFSLCFIFFKCTIIFGLKIAGKYNRMCNGINLTITRNGMKFKITEKLGS